MGREASKDARGQRSIRGRSGTLKLASTKVLSETWGQHRVIDACAVAFRFAAATLSRDTLRLISIGCFYRAVKIRRPDLD